MESEFRWSRQNDVMSNSGHFSLPKYSEYLTSPNETMKELLPLVFTKTFDSDAEAPDLILPTTWYCLGHIWFPRAAAVLLDTVWIG